MPRRILLLALVIHFSPAWTSLVWADDAEQTREAARSLVQAKQNVEAATLLGKALAKAQKKGDIVLQQELADAIGSELGHLKASELPGAEGTYRDCCYTMMKLLAPKRAGVCLSAHHLACELLFQCVRGGDERYLKEAAALCVKFANGKNRGMHAKAVKMLAEGLVLARAGKHDKSYPLLTKALDLCIRNGWNTTTAFVAIEMQATLKALARKREAIKLTDKVIASIDRTSDRNAAQLYREAWTTRLGDMPAEVDAQIRKLDGGPGAAGAAGGAGGAGGSGGDGLSAVGRKLRKFSARKPLVSAQLVAAGFDVRHFFDGHKTTHDLAKGVTHQADGGVTLSFWGVGVRLAMVDPTGRNGQPGEGSAPSRWEFFYRLSRDETWSFNKRGEVSIR